MDFIERWFGISPDGGNGLLELLILASLIVLGAMIVARRRARKRRRL
jgi:hypothetical protein